MAEKHLFTVTGDEKIIKAFKALGPEFEKRVVRPEVQHVCKVLESAIHSGAPVLSGTMRRSIRVISARGPRAFQGRKVVAFAVITGKGKPNKREKQRGVKIPSYTFMQEKGFHVGVRHRQGSRVIGYTAHRGNLGGQGIKFVPGKFFIKKAMHQNEASLTAQLLFKLYHGIDELAEELGHKS